MSLEMRKSPCGRGEVGGVWILQDLIDQCEETELDLEGHEEA